MQRRVHTSRSHVNATSSVRSNFQYIFIFGILIIIASFILFGTRLIESPTNNMDQIKVSFNNDVPKLEIQNDKIQLQTAKNQNKINKINNKSLRITLTIATNISPSRLFIFIASFRKWHPVTDDINDKQYKLYLFTKFNEEKYLIEYKKLSSYFNIILVDMEAIENALDHKYLELFNIRMRYIKINKRRFFILNYWLNEFAEENSEDIDCIFVTDSNDVIFQGNIFTLYDDTLDTNQMSLSSNQQLFWFFMENPDVTMAADKWNRRYIKYCFGNDTVPEYVGVHVSCSGTSLATYEAMYQYLKIMNEILVKQGPLFHDCLRKPGDQAIHNIILHKEYLLDKNIKVVRVPNDSGWILQITSMINHPYWSKKVPKMSQNAMVVHQWKWALTVKKRYEKEYNYNTFCNKQQWSKCTVSTG